MRLTWDAVIGLDLQKDSSPRARAVSYLIELLRSGWKLGTEIPPTVGENDEDGRAVLEYLNDLPANR